MDEPNQPPTVPEILAWMRERQATCEHTWNPWDAHDVPGGVLHTVVCRKCGRTMTVCWGE